MNAGIATAARMPMIATTIISSISVKPRSFILFSIRDSFEDWCLSSRSGAGSSTRETQENASVFAARRGRTFLRGVDLALHVAAGGRVHVEAVAELVGVAVQVGDR